MAYQMHGFPNQAHPSKDEEVNMWQQGGYSVFDSGVASGATTAAHSVREEDLVENSIQFDMDSQDYNGFPPDITELAPECQQQRVRPNMFPDGLTEGEEMPGTPFVDPTQPPTGVQQQPTEGCEPGLIYQNGADLATRVIPDLITLLHDEDQVVVSKAAMTVHQLSKQKMSCLAIMNSPQMMSTLVRAIGASNDLETIKGAAGTLHNVSLHAQGLLAIFKSGGIPALVKLLSCPVEAPSFYAITILHSLLLQQEGSKIAVRLAGGVQKMVTLLQRENVKFLAIVTDCLQILAYGNQESKMIIMQTGGHKELVRILTTYNYEKLLVTTCRVLKVLSICAPIKRPIVEAGGMQALAIHLGHPNKRLVVNCLVTLRNLSDAATQMQEGLEGLLQSLVNVLGSGESENVTCAVGILSNLTCNNQRNKMVVCQFNGIDALVRTVRMAGDREEIIEPAICALRHLTRDGHPESEAAQNAVRSTNGIPIIAKLMQPPSSWSVIKAAIGLVRNLAGCPPNQVALREHGMVARLGHLLARALQEGRNIVDGVRMTEIVEGTVGALQGLAQEIHNRAQIMSMNMVVPTFVQLLYHEQPSIQKVAVGVLFELATDKEGVDVIERADAHPPLMKLVQSPNEDVAIYAQETLFRLQAFHKGGHMDMNPTQIFDQETMWGHDMSAPPPDFQDNYLMMDFDAMDIEPFNNSTMNSHAPPHGGGGGGPSHQPPPGGYGNPNSACW